jgi:hypothetical protein
MTTRDSHSQGDTRTMASKTNSNTQNVPTNAADFLNMANAMLQDVPAATLQAVKQERPRGNTAANAAAMVKALLASSTEVKTIKFEDVSDWTQYRRSTKALESATFGEVRNAIRVACSTTSGKAYMRLPRKGEEQIRLVNVERNPLNAAKAIITDVALLKGRKQSDGTRSAIGDAGRYFARALEHLDDAQREQVAEFARTLGNSDNS